MSFILDALRKSEHERQRQAGPSLADLPVARPRSRYPLAYLILGVLLALNLAALAYFMLRSESRPQLVAPEATAAAEHAPVGPPPAPPQAAIQARTVAPAPPKPPIRPLGAEAQPQYDQPAPAHLGAPEAPDPTLLPEPPRAAATPARPVAHAVSRVTAEGVPGLDDLPPSATAGLPLLNLDLHVYGPDAAKRFVFINNRRYVEGNTTPEGIRIERITPDGVILDHRGTRFLLSRP